MLNQTKRQAIFRDVTNAGFDRVFVAAKAHRFTVEVDFSAVRFGHAKQAERQFSTTATEQSAEPQHFSGVQFKTDVVILARTGEFVGFQHDAFVIHVGGFQAVIEFQPGHQFGQVFAADFRRRECADFFAVAYNRHAVGNLQHLIEAMADEHHADAFAFQIVHGAQQLIHFGAGQRGGRLIHNH
ncbi:hypothetical protein D3C73_1048430 [compost metagenome]